MVIIPREKPAIQNLNSYYLNIEKLVEHYQGEFGAGGIHFKSLSAEGMIFFDKDELLTAAFQDKDGEIEGQKAVDLLMEAKGGHNFTVNIYEIEYEKVYYWANTYTAKKMYEGLSTDTTDLEGLLTKMSLQKLTGYVDVLIGKGKESGLIFFHNGDMVGGSYSWGNGKVRNFREDQELLIQKVKEWGGTFNVGKISPIMADKENGKIQTSQKLLSNALSMLEELLNAFEEIVASNRKIKTGFSTLLKKKFVELVDRYDFLDPFAAEFEYSDKKISFRGDASAEDLVNGVVESVKGLANELGILHRLEYKLDPWFKRHGDTLTKYGISFR